MDLIAFPDNLPSTPNPSALKQDFLDMLRVFNPTLSMGVFDEFVLLMTYKTATSQVEQMRIESKKVNGIPVTEQMQTALAEYVVCQHGLIV